MIKKLILLSALVLCSTLASANESISANPEPSVSATPESGSWLSSGRLTLTGRLLEDYEEYAGGLLLPVLSSDQAAALADIRGSFLEDLEQEVNAGLVFRYHLEDAGIILGINGYYDGRWTDLNNRFDQAAGGVDVLTRWVDLRANYYYPVADEVILEESEQTTVERTPATRTETTVRYRSYEEALDGFDTEVGVWVPWLSKYLPTVVCAGYYQFYSDLIEDDEFGGFKARIETRLHPNVAISGEWFEKTALNQSEYIASVRFQAPLDFWRKTKLESSGGPYNPLSSRMTEEVQRDLRVRVVKTGPVEYAREVLQYEIVSKPQPSPAPIPRPVVCNDVFVVDPVTGTITVQTVCK